MTLTKDKKLFLRKMIMAGSVAFLACVYVLQLLAGAKSPVKNFGIEKGFDTIRITSAANASFELKKTEEAWTVDSLPAEDGEIRTVLDVLSEIRCLGVVEKSNAPAVNERYGFVENQKINVSVLSGEKSLLSMEIGKDAANGTQNYVRINGGNEIYLAANPLRETFGVEKENFVKKEPEKDEEKNGADKDSAVSAE